MKNQHNAFYRLLLLDKDANFTKTEKRLYGVLLFFFLSIYFSPADWLYNIATWLVFVFCFFVNTFSEKKQLLKQRPEMIGMMIFFIVNVISALISANVSEGFSWVGIRISLIIFPLAIGSVYISHLLKERILFAYLSATWIAALGALIWAFARMMIYHDASLIYNDNLSEPVNLQSIYFATLINLAILCFLYLQTHSSRLVSQKGWWVVIPLLLIAQFLLASRMAITTLVISIVIGAIYLGFWKKKRMLALAIMTTLVVVASLFLAIFPKTINRFRELGYRKFNFASQSTESHFNSKLTPDQWNGANIRLAVWQCGWEVAKEHFVAGTGLGDKMDLLKEKYAEKGFLFGVQTNRNTHNTYLDIWISMGIIGLLIFLGAFLFVPIFRCWRVRDWYGAIAVLLLAIAMFSETYLDRTMGNTVLSFFLSFISSYKPGRALLRN